MVDESDAPPQTFVREYRGPEKWARASAVDDIEPMSREGWQVESTEWVEKKGPLGCAGSPLMVMARIRYPPEPEGALRVTFRSQGDALGAKRESNRHE